MAITKVLITFESVHVRDSADIWGVGDWHFNATVDGKPVGNRGTEFEAREGNTITLPQPEWSVVIDVSTKVAGDKIVAEFGGVDVDVLWDDDLGKVRAEFAHPFKPKSVSLASPTIKKFLFKDRAYYALTISMKVAEEVATATLSGPGSVAVSRQTDGSVTFSTVGGTVEPRVEVCPVIPVPNALSKLPTRPTLPPALLAGVDTTHAAPITLLPVPAARNDLVNPAVIPALDATDPDLNSKAARLAVTHVAPGDLDTSALVWTVKSGPAVFVGNNNTGPTVLVRGTSGAAADAMAQFEVRWGTDKGPPLAEYRAWVGKVKTALYRCNIIMGSTAATSPTGILSPADIDAQMKICALLLWQVGIDFKPDTTTTTFDNAKTVDGAGNALPAGIYMVRGANNAQTTNVNINGPSRAGHLNFRPGVLNIGYIRRSPQMRAAAQGVRGVGPSPAPNETLGGSPSTSWCAPSGVKLDPAATPVSMAIFGIFRSTTGTANAFDNAYTTHRKATQPAFTKAMLDQLYSVVVPADWLGLVGNSANRGVNVAHEMGHALGLRHRGSGGHNGAAINVPGPSNDQVSSVNAAGVTYGHPWHENVMSYGYANANLPLALDFDLIQAVVMRRHPACT